MARMLPNILRNLFSRPATVRHPFIRREPFPGHRGEITFDMEKCDFCQDCERLCPPAAIKVDPEAKTLTYDPFKCIYCYVCVTNCLQRAVRGRPAYTSPAYQKEVKQYKQEG